MAALFIFHICLSCFSCRNLYQSEIITVDYASVSEGNTTVAVSESQDIAPCSCNRTPNLCDVYCCCDLECGDTLINSWKGDLSNNKCSDVRDDSFFSLSMCNTESYVYNYNARYSLSDYRSPLLNILCVMYDNSGDKGNFYKNALLYDSSQLLAVYQSFLNAKADLYYYPQLNTGVNFGTDYSGYLSGSYIRSRRISMLNYENEGKTYMIGPNEIGLCERNKPLKFFESQDKEDSKCGVKFQKLSDCKLNDWKNQLLTNIEFASYPSNSSPYIKITTNSLYIKNYGTNLLSEIYIDATKPYDLSYIPSTESVIDSNDSSQCYCNNVLSEISYNLIVDETLSKIKEIRLDIMLLSNLKGNCNSQKLITLKNSVKFFPYSNLFVRSGAPGYLSGSNLLIAQQITLVNGNVDLILPNVGYSIVGKDNLGNCISQTPQKDESLPYLPDKPSYYDSDNFVKYNQNVEYTCTLPAITSDRFEDFCSNYNPKTLQIFNQLSQINFIGIFGNSSVKSRLDWIIPIIVGDLSSVWDAQTQTCSFVDTMQLEILYTKAGNIELPQEYIVGAKINYIKSQRSYYSFLDEDSKTITKGFQVKLRVNYFDLSESLFSVKKTDTSFRLYLPFNIPNPFVSS